MFNTSKNSELMEFLKTIPYFQTLPANLIKKIASEFDSTFIKGGDVLIKQGEPGDCLYIVQSGRLVAFKKTDNGEEEVGEIVRGGLIGELSLFTQAPRSATVIAIRDSILWELTKSEFEEFVQKNPLHIMPMVKSAILRLLNPPKRHNEAISTLAIAQAGTYPLDQSVTQALVKEFTQLAPTHYLNSAILKEQFKDINWDSSDQTTPSHAKIVDWLNTQEQTYRYIIYETDPTNSYWTQLCLRQADKIILLADSRDSPILNEIENALFEQPKKILPKVDLILLHSETILLPNNTSLWLKERPANVRHIQKGNPEHIHRLVRTIVGQSVALVLGGGGAKSLAHIGVYKALCELKIPIDILGGTSMGSIIAAAIAMNKSPEEVLKNAEDYIVNDKKFMDYTIPTVALLGGASWLKNMKKMYGEMVYIEDLWRSFFCIASNYTLRQMEVLDKGLLYKAVRASVSLPGIVPPISNDNYELLIDGGIFNNLPVDVMRKMAPNSKIIAVRVSPYTDIHANIPDGIVSGVKRFFKRSSSSAVPTEVPGIAEIILGAITLRNGEREERRLLEADVPIDLNLSEFRLFDFAKIHQLVEIGYQKTMEHFTNNPLN